MRAVEPPPDRESTVRAAAIRNDGSGDVDALLARVVAVESARGRRLRGLLMTFPDGRDSCQCAMELVDVATGDVYRVSQALGAGSDACRADTAGFARASDVLRRALAERDDLDLVICNRFGVLGSQGGGFVAELLELMAAGVPVLTVVSSRHLDAWERITGGATLLAAEEGAIRAWIAASLARG